MSEEWEGKTLGLHPEEVRCDSGLADSLRSLQDEGLPRFPDSSLPHKAAEQPGDSQDAERIDSSYGSASITEGLPLKSTEPAPPQALIGEPEILVAGRAPQTGTAPLAEDTPTAGATEPDPQTASLPPRGVTESLGTERINSFTYVSEEGDT
ncbi:uncharacterized protein ACMZJ9_020878, partial [Mantella aurantiaca]